MTLCRLLPTILFSAYITFLADADVSVTLHPLKFVGRIDDIGQLSAEDRATFLRGLCNFLRQSAKKRSRAWLQSAIALQLAVLGNKLRRQRRSMEPAWISNTDLSS